MEENYLCYYVKKSINYCQFLQMIIFYFKHEAGWSAVELWLTLAKVAAQEWSERASFGPLMDEIRGLN
ncbi:hypothetical protein CsSME_00001231 [Camellia sinensis var. sinensis]